LRTSIFHFPFSIFYLPLFLFFASPVAAQGSLENFEAGVARPGHDASARAVAAADTPAVARQAKADDDDDGYFELFLSLLRIGLILPQALAEAAGTGELFDDQRADLRLLYGADKGPLTHWAVDGRVHLGRGLGLSAGHLGYHERIGGRTDHLEFYRANARYQVGSLRNAAGLELGGRWMTGGSRVRSGLDGAVTVDISPHQVLHFDASFRVARLSASTIRESVIGVTGYYKAVGLRFGYRNLDSGRSHLEGIEAGVAVSF
jgi:hypothetical protein